MRKNSIKQGNCREKEVLAQRALRESIWEIPLPTVRESMIMVGGIMMILGYITPLCYYTHIPNIFGGSIVAQLHFYVPDKFATEIRKRAKQAHLPVSRFLVDIISREIGTEWPENYFNDIGGGWHGEALKREPEGALENRLDF